MSSRPPKKTKRQTKLKAAKPGSVPDVDGDGLMDYFSPRNDYNNTSKSTLGQYGNWHVIRIDLQRTPIQSMIRKAMDLISFGKFSSMSKKQGFDKFFHLAALITVERDGVKKLITVEKNHVLNISTTSKNDSNAEIQHVAIQPGMTLNDMLNRAKAKMGDSYFKYDAMSHNCQDFIRWFLDESGYLTPALKSWLFQDVSKIAQAMPGVSRITRAITDVAAVGDRLMGNGEPRLTGGGRYKDAVSDACNEANTAILEAYHDGDMLITGERLRTLKRLLDAVKKIAHHILRKNVRDYDAKDYVITLVQEFLQYVLAHINDRVSTRSDGVYFVAEHQLENLLGDLNYFNELLIHNTTEHTETLVDQVDERIVERRDAYHDARREARREARHAARDARHAARDARNAARGIPPRTITVQNPDGSLSVGERESLSVARERRARAAAAAATPAAERTPAAVGLDAETLASAIADVEAGRTLPTTEESKRDDAWDDGDTAGSGAFTDEMRKMWNLVKHMWGAKGRADAEWQKYLKLNHDMNAKLGYKTGGGLDRDQFLDLADEASRHYDGKRPDKESITDFSLRLVTLKHKILRQLSPEQELRRPELEIVLDNMVAGALAGGREVTDADWENLQNILFPPTTGGRGLPKSKKSKPTKLEALIGGLLDNTAQDFAEKRAALMREHSRANPIKPLSAAEQASRDAYQEQWAQEQRDAASKRKSDKAAVRLAARDAFEERTGRAGFRKLNNALIDVANVAVKAPFMPSVVKKAYEHFGPEAMGYQR